MQDLSNSFQPSVWNNIFKIIESLRVSNNFWQEKALLPTKNPRERALQERRENRPLKSLHELLLKYLFNLIKELFLLRKKRKLLWITKILFYLRGKKLGSREEMHLNKEWKLVLLKLASGNHFCTSLLLCLIWICGWRSIRKLERKIQSLCKRKLSSS